MQRYIYVWTPDHQGKLLSYNENREQYVFALLVLSVDNLKLYIYTYIQSHKTCLSEEQSIQTHKFSQRHKDKNKHGLVSIGIWRWLLICWTTYRHLTIVEEDDDDDDG